MYRQIKPTPASSRATPEALAVFLLEGVKQLPEGYRELDERSGGVLSAALQRAEFAAGRGSVTTLYPAQGPGRLFVCGLGDPERFDGNALRAAAAKLARAAFAARVQRIELAVLPGVGDRLAPEAAGAAVADGLAIAGFDFDAFKGAANGKNHKDKPAKPIDLAVAVDPELRAAVRRGLVVGQALTHARTLAATPPNVANPAYLADHCRKLARRVGLTCTVIDEARARKLGMGGLVAVGGGGSVPPVLICLEWPGRKARNNSKAKAKGKAKKTAAARPVLLVGKAVTFDTGGYSLKIGGSMTGMKYDKCGGMAVIGAMEAAALLELDTPVVGVIPAAENMIDDDAYRVDDILTFYNGVTTEVTNTDAEGRLILADALAYATQAYQPRAVVDLATLTGGVVVALGSACAGLFCNDDDLRRRLDAAADATGERLWPLPLWPEHRDMMKGTHADLVNAGEREAHPIQGAAFLSYFVGDDAPKRMPTLPWAHLDIAGVAEAKKETPLFAKGPTGYGVRLLTQLLEDWR